MELVLFIVITFPCSIALGVGIHYIGLGPLDNNTLVVVDSDQTIGDIHCASGSSLANVGQWIGPTRNDLTNSTVDPFNVLLGDERDPGSLVIQQASGHVITNSFQGVYTCVMPDEVGVQKYLHVGIYRNGFSCELALH